MIRSWCSPALFSYFGLARRKCSRERPMTDAAVTATAGSDRADTMAWDLRGGA
jgi:hypothetical protein